MTVTDPASFSAVIPMPPLRRLFGAVAVLVDDFRLQIGTMGLSVSVTDGANVAAVEATLADEAMFSFDLRREGEVCVDAKKVKALLESVANIMPDPLGSVRVETRVVKEKPCLDFEADNIYYSIPLEDPKGTRKNTSLPEMKFQGAITIPASTLKRICDGAGAASDYLIFKTVPEAPDRLLVRTRGDDSGQFAVNLTGLRRFGEEKEFKSIFSTDYLSDITHFLADDPGARVDLYLADEYPLRLDTALFSGKDGILRFLQAPRIETEAEE